MSLFGWVDKYNDDLPTMLRAFGNTLYWYWSQMTLLSILLTIIIISILVLTYLAFSDRKRLASRAYWRGYRNKEHEDFDALLKTLKEAEKYWDNSYAHPEDK